MPVPGSTADLFLRWARGLFVALVCALVFLGIGTYAAVHHTAQPEFCGSCHLMEPYVETWRESAHRDVACIECHYEPGGVETFEGKFKALSQVAKYVTNTAGTKPFAEVSDQSCLRAGCHTVPLLAGRIEFRTAAFDHEAHLLESRRGKRLRCTTCHTHVLEGEHFTVEARVCFTCHFKPDPRTGERPPHGACTVCHEAPAGPVEVAGRPFQHQPFTARGVACTECHGSAVEGEGQVRRERCHSCHEEAGHVEHMDEPAMLHERHVAEHKVECFECHDDIQHGLLPRQTLREGRDCAACHSQPHEEVLAFQEGRAGGLEAGPRDRMHELGMACTACHSGRSASGEPAAHDGHGELPAAGDVDCMHCHGVGFDGMLARWQDSLAGHVEALRGRYRQLAGEGGGEGVEALAEAGQVLEAVVADPSRGAHNIRLSRELLYRAAEDLDLAWRQARGEDPEAPVLDRLPPRDRAGCALACHAGIEAEEATTLADGRTMPHRRHLLVARLACERCHESTPHGAPAFPRTRCADCHHSGEGALAERECGDCHAAQTAMQEGTLGAPREEIPSVMADLDCSDCHGEAPDVVRPGPELCVGCHEEGYDEMLGDWQGTVAEYMEGVTEGLRTATERGIGEAARQRAREIGEAVLQDGSRGAHNPMLAESLLEEALELLEVD